MENQIISINLVPNMSTPAVVRVSQYDVGRPLVFKVYDGTSPADLTGVTAVIEGTKRSGLGFSESGTVSDNTVTLDTTLAMTQEDGSIPAEIRFTKTGEDVGTANFILAVEKSPHLEGTTDGTTETMADLQSQLDALDERVEALEGGGGGLTQAEKQLILTLFCKAAYAEDDASTAYDRLEALWTIITRLVSLNLTHVTSSNQSASVENGSRYVTNLTADTNYTLNSVSVTMGGVDITSTAYSSGTVSIPSVTGNIVITATAVLAAQSITAVYTQSGTVYDTDTLDSLKADLVVTANSSGGTSETVPASDYTLSGTLAVGTSTITVSYAGLTDTFDVTVAEVAQYAMNDYDNTSVGNSRLTVTNGNHVTITTTENSRSIYVFKNHEPNAGYNTGWTVGEYFDIPAGATVETKIKNITYTGNTDSGNNLNISTKDSTNTAITHSATVSVSVTGDGTLSDSTKTETLTTTEATTVKAFCFFIYRAVTIEFDLEIRVNGSRYI